MKNLNILSKMLDKVSSVKFQELKANYKTIDDLPDESSAKNLGIVADNGYLYIDLKVNINMESLSYEDCAGMLIEVEDHIYLGTTIIKKDGSTHSFHEVFSHRVFPVSEFFNENVANIKFGERNE